MQIAYAAGRRYHFAASRAMEIILSMHRQLTPLITAGGGGVLGEAQWYAIRARMARVARLNLTLGAVVLFLALMLRRV